jgi:hypothetical protein
VSPVRRSFSALFLAVAALLVVGAFGCTPASSAPPSTTAPHTSDAHPSPAPSAAAADEWLSGDAGRWNSALNGDQNSVDSAATTTGGVSTSAYFSRLSAACATMLDDAEKATSVNSAPERALEDGWKGMLAATETYAKACLQVVRSRSTSALDGWKDTLRSMNAANQKWNQAVAAVRHP